MKFSIVTPSFNQSQFITQTIDSVISQKGSFDIEYFVMDGGSTDNTVEILKEYEMLLNNNSRIKFFWQSKKDKGQSDAINQGFQKATGDILAFINSDDYYQPDVFQKIATQFSQNPHRHWLTGYSHIVDENDRLIQKPITQYKNFWLNNYSYSTLLILNYISQPSTFFTKKIFNQIGKFNEKLNYTMDYDYWLKIGKNSQPIILKKYLSSFRLHSSSKSKTHYKKQFSEDFSTTQIYSQNYLILFFHRFHNFLITQVYKIIK
ncbi:MAG: Glycosyl transferase family 2 [Candidatus Shapirobacteria bacterium GW2011_GWE1_38_92]|uniref:Glycosyl transferase family 2 n=3 Tax=Candidatus Shapironibacteriota TaxID=1752721 RepID=A0A0G0JUZ4_9BACT|nr:MAG: Glycosyl transferase family 2 [Candidatus Shapirobacteria bacterium GW2011_GWE2_38_30]KKQ92825.1 MAG: Glycosyl transferase family 2 [Candidatus Shapirobacteria bacterium GW2011_GWE1_38_92]OGL56323.1 MAG: hypothetical protein A2367_03430 [Candidatus Shapirobacteria bacterium RIFOXYB1_FULL_38_38]